MAGTQRSAPAGTDQSRRVLDREWRMLVGGEPYAAATGRSWANESPVTEEAIADVPDACEADVDKAVRAAASGFARWRRFDARERGRVVRDLARVLREHTDELALLDAWDCGNPVTAMRGDVSAAAEVMELFAAWAMELKGDTVPASAQHLHFTTREPFGVVARIVPFNHPILFAAAKIAPALVAGNSVVLKPAEQAPLSALRMGEVFAPLLPAGVLSVLTGSGPETGRAIVRHADVRRIGFIGSEPTGRAIQRDAADSGVKDITLELGGKNAMVVFPDADLGRAAAGAVAGMNFAWSQGQSCGSNSRLLLHSSIADEVLDAIVERTRAIRVGSPLDPATEMGTLACRAQYDKTLQYIEVAQHERARLATGGGRPSGAGFDRGYYVEPTVFADVRPQMRIAREEIFGPVLAVQTWEDEEEAVRLANGVDYGLTASVWTSDVTRAHRVAAKLEAGYVWVNGSARHFWGMPFGGWKSSGVGREESLEELLSYTQLKTVNVLLGDG